MPEGETFSTKTGIIDPGYNNTVTAVSRPPKSSVEAAVPAAIPSHATRLRNASARRARAPHRYENKNAQPDASGWAF